MPITPRKWVPIKPITPLFERAIDPYNSHHSKILEKYRKSPENLLKLSLISEKSRKVDFNEGQGAPTMTVYNTHHLKNHEKARQKLPITPIIPKVAGCYNPPSL